MLIARPARAERYEGERGEGRGAVNGAVRRDEKRREKGKE